jgi:hypothetical protein
MVQVFADSEWALAARRTAATAQRMIEIERFMNPTLKDGYGEGDMIPGTVPGPL